MQERSTEKIEKKEFMAEKKPDQEFVEFVVKSLADHPEDVKIERKVDEMGVLLTIKAHPSDMGQLIGKKGATIKAIKDLARIIGLKNHARVTVKLLEPETGRK